MTHLRTDLQIMQNKIDELMFVGVDKKVIIEPKIIEEFEFKTYKWNVYVHPRDKNMKHEIYDKITSLLTNDPYFIRKNVIENIYKVYIQRVKLEKVLKQKLEENNLTKTKYMEEINNRIELLYKKYCTII